MQLFVRAAGTHCLEVPAGASAADVLSALEARTGAPADAGRVVFGGKQLAADEPLSAAGVEEAATLEVLGRLLGGGKKRKKKTYTKPKKNKHQHKNVKLRVLKYYKVEDSGKVQRTRRMCPAEECGAGIFMATHKDRVHCGKCNLTYLYAEGKQ